MRFSSNIIRQKSGFGAKMCLRRDHLGNVRVVLSDAKLIVDNGTAGVVDASDSFEPEVLSYADYMPFGFLTPGRQFNANTMKRGYNGQERDDEIAGVGNIMTAEYWEYDARIARRWNMDPEYHSFACESPYAVFHNNPIFFNDLLGNKPGDPNKAAKKFGKKVDKEMKRDKDLTIEQAIQNVEDKLSDWNKVVTYKEPTPGGDNLKYSTRNVADVYRESQIDLSHPSSPPSGPVTNELTVVLDKSTKTEGTQTFDTGYEVKTVPGAVSSELIITNSGKEAGTVKVSVSTIGSDETVPVMNPNGIIVPPGKSVTVPVATNVSFITTEEIVKTQGQATHGNIDITIKSQPLPSNPVKFSEPLRSKKKPTLAEIKEHFK